MNGKSTRTKGKAEPEAPDLTVLAEQWSERRSLTGSDSGMFNLKLLNQVWNALWRLENGAEWAKRMGEIAARGALRGIAPRDPLEGMLAAQMIATHEAAMECFRRAHIPEQTFEGRQVALGQANKLVRSYAALVEALDRHRGKGQQLVRVEHVHVHSGGQAIVGAVGHPGGGGEAESEERPHAKQLTHAPEPALRGADPEREPVPVAGGTGEAPL